VGLIDRVGSLLRLRALRYDTSLEDAGVDPRTVAARVGRSELFCNLEESLIHELLEAMEVTQVRAGATIMRQGERSDTYLVLAAGNAIVTYTPEGEETRILATLSEPTGLGEEALLGAGSRSVSVTMETDGTLLRVKRDTFAAFVGKQAVEWVERDALESAGNNANWLWFGPNGRQRINRPGAVSLQLNQLRERLVSFDREHKYYCCCKDTKESATAAFVLRQRGFEAYAVRNGRTAIAQEGK